MEKIFVQRNLIRYKNLLKESKFLSFLDPLLYDFIFIQIKSEYRNNSKEKDLKIVEKEIKKSNKFHDILHKINVNIFFIYRIFF